MGNALLIREKNSSYNELKGCVSKGGSMITIALILIAIGASILIQEARGK